MTEAERIRQLFNTLLQADMQNFPATGRLDITCEKGVYIIYNSNGKVSHVGNTPRGQKGLCQRLNNHIGKSSSFAQKFLIPQGLSIRDGFRFKLLEVASARERILLECLACGELCPEHIGTHEALA